MLNPLIYSGPHSATFTSSCKCISNTVLTSAIKHIYVFQHMIAGPQFLFPIFVEPFSTALVPLPHKT